MSKSLPQLQNLYLPYNEIKDLTGMSEALPQLQILNLSANQLSDLVGMPQALPDLHYLNLDQNPLISLYGISKDIDEKIDIDLNYEKLDQYGQAFAKGCFIDKKHSQCEKLHEYYTYSDAELTNIYVSGNVSDEFFLETSDEMKRILPERIRHRLNHEIEKTLYLLKK